MNRGFRLGSLLVQRPDGTVVVANLHFAAYFCARGHRVLAFMSRGKSGKTGFVFGVNEMFIRHVLEFDSNVSIPIRDFLDACNKLQDRAYGPKGRPRQGFGAQESVAGESANTSSSANSSLVFTTRD